MAGLPATLGQVAPRQPRAFPKRIPLKAQRVISLICQGHSKEEIAHALSLSPAAVSAIMQNPSCAAFLDGIMREHETEFRALAPLAVNGLRQGLRSPDIPTALNAARAWYGIREKISGESTERATTAEDLVERAYEVHAEIEGSGTVTLRLGERTRTQKALPQETSDADPF